MLAVELDEELLPLVDRWLPLSAPLLDRSPPSLIRAAHGRAPVRAPAMEPDLRLGSVRAWIHGDRALLVGSAGATGAVALDGCRADVWSPGGESADALADLYSMLTLSTALLLARMGRALVHAAGVVSPLGEGWLLVGDARAGKSTTTANLIARGWRYLSDDHVVLHRDGRRVIVTGLPRCFHLDEGWGTPTPAGRRRSVDPDAMPGSRRATAAPLGRVLLPGVDRGRPTTIRPASAGDGVAALIRQSPWILADRGSGEPLLRVLQALAGTPVLSVSLGLDSFGAPDLLERVLLSPSLSRDASGSG